MLFLNITRWSSHAVWFFDAVTRAQMKTNYSQEAADARTIHSNARDWHLKKDRKIICGETE